jgi:PAS domain S-box-containing protein
MLHSVRAYLLTLVAICIVLATCAFAFLAAGAVEASRKQAEAQTLETAKVLSQAVDRELEHSVGVLTALRQSRAANRQEWSVLDQQARAAISGNTDDWIVVQDRSGRQLVNTRLPKGAALPKGTAPQYMWRELQSGTQRVCDLVEGQLEKHVVCVDAPIGTSRQFAISMMFRPQFFESIVRREGVSDGSIATLVDGDARVIWRNPGGLAYVGRQATGDMLEALQAGRRSGVLESTTLDGVRVLSAIQQSPLSGWTVIVGTPLHEMTGSVGSTVLRGSALALLVLAIGCVLAVYVASRLAKAMRVLSQPHGSGSRLARTGIREIDDAAAALERAAVADDHIRASEAKFRRIFEQTSDLLITADLNQVITDANPAAADAVGLSLPEVIGRRISNFVSPDDFEKTSAMLRQKLEQGGTTRYDVRVRNSRGEWLFWEINSGLTHDEEGNPLGLHIVGRDVTERKRSERQTQVLLGELNHRVKNTLAVVQSLAHQTFRGNGELEKPKVAFEGRLKALAATHNLLTRQHWEYASMRELVENSIGPFCGEGRCSIEGLDFRLTPQAAVSISLAIHELATNAVKYGALSGSKGHVRVSWKREQDHFWFEWRESDGPPPAAEPKRRGFGTQLIERTLASELGGTVEMKFEPSGLVCRLTTSQTARIDASHEKSPS